MNIEKIACSTPDFAKENAALNKEINIPQLTYTTRKAEQISGSAFAACVHESKQVDEYFTETGVKYDLS